MISYWNGWNNAIFVSICNYPFGGLPLKCVGRDPLAITAPSQTYEHIDTIKSETVRKTHRDWNFLMKRGLVAVLSDCRIETFHHCQGWKIVEFAITLSDGNFLLDI